MVTNVITYHNYIFINEFILRVLLGTQRLTNIYSYVATLRQYAQKEPFGLNINLKSGDLCFCRICTLSSPCFLCLMYCASLDFTPRVLFYSEIKAKTLQIMPCSSVIPGCTLFIMIKLLIINHLMTYIYYYTYVRSCITATCISVFSVYPILRFLMCCN